MKLLLQSLTNSNCIGSIYPWSFIFFWISLVASSSIKCIFTSFLYRYFLFFSFLASEAEWSARSFKLSFMMTSRLNRSTKLAKNMILLLMTFMSVVSRKISAFLAGLLLGAVNRLKTA